MYWDTAATTKPKPEVIEAMMPYFTDKWYNPSSTYELAREVRRDVEKARKIVAKSINADPDEIIFTSGGSEGNTFCTNTDGVIIQSNIEHSSLKPDYANGILNVDSSGLIYPSDLKYKFSLLYRGGLNIVTVQLANNEIGTIQHVTKIAEIAHEQEYYFHTDAVQAYGKIPIDVKKMGIDMLSASGHKIGAPKGIGFVYINKYVPLELSLIDGTQEHGLRGGTENVPYIIGLAKAVELIDYSKQEHMKEMYEYLEEQLSEMATFNGHSTQRLYNIASITFNDDIDNQALIGMLDDMGQYVSAGSACHAYAKEPSHVLKAIGLSDDEINRTIRVSFLDDITKEDIDKLVNDIKICIEILKGLKGMN